MTYDAEGGVAAPARSVRVPVVAAEDLTVTYGRGRRAVTALVSATFRLEPDDRVALVGPSGSGKSTLVHVISGLLPASAGRIAWPALSADRLPAGAAGVVFQGLSLIPTLDVLENVELPLQINTTEPPATVRRRAVTALDELDLGDLATALPNELSGGQAQRVAVARVLAARPKLICADEPSGQLDAVNAEVVTDHLLHAAATLNAPLIVATHDQAVADRMNTTWSIADGVLSGAGEATCSS
jgi:ABC-type lipoprotein export system ATPase subunit